MGAQHLPVRRSRPTTAQAIKQIELTPTLENIDTRKVCVEDTISSRTLRRVYTTPRGSHPSMPLIANSIVVVSKRPKTKRQ